MYANYSMGAEKGAGVTAPTAGGADTVAVDVRILQQHLVRAGFNVGSSGVDGRWGRGTEGALTRALAAAGMIGPLSLYRVEGNRVALARVAYSAIKRLPAGAGGERPSAVRPPTAPGPEAPPSDALYTRGAPSGASIFAAVPWWAWAALAAAGGYGVYAWSKRRPASRRAAA